MRKDFEEVLSKLTRESALETRPSQESWGVLLDLMTEVGKEETKELVALLAKFAHGPVPAMVQEIIATAFAYGVLSFIDIAQADSMFDLKRMDELHARTLRKAGH